jgi:nicotinamide-nucleotide amidase
MSASRRLANDLVESLISRGENLALAESVTGGELAAAITDIAGSSQIFMGSLVTYSNSSKVALLGLDVAIIERCGVVSDKVALAMAEGARTRLGTVWSVATTGIAGPGPYDGVPAGRVWVAVAGPVSRVEKLELGEIGREQVRNGAVIGALALLTRILREHAGGLGNGSVPQ